MSPGQVLAGLGDAQTLAPELLLEYRSYQYLWPDAMAIERDLTLTDKVELLDTMRRVQSPAAFFEEERAEL